MNQLGNKIAQKRKELGMTQMEFADKMLVTRQTVSRWEAGTVMPDIDKISDIASLLQVTCDYLLKDEITESETAVVKYTSRLLQKARGEKVRLSFVDGEADSDLYNLTCTIVDFEGNWVNVEADTRKGHIQKLIPLSSILSMEIIREEN